MPIAAKNARRRRALVRAPRGFLFSREMCARRADTSTRGRGGVARRSSVSSPGSREPSPRVARARARLGPPRGAHGPPAAKADDVRRGGRRRPRSVPPNPKRRRGFGPREGDRARRHPRAHARGFHRRRSTPPRPRSPGGGRPPAASLLSQPIPVRGRRRDRLRPRQGFRLRHAPSQPRQRREMPSRRVSCAAANPASDRTPSDPTAPQSASSCANSSGATSPRIAQRIRPSTSPATACGSARTRPSAKNSSRSSSDAARSTIDSARPSPRRLRNCAPVADVAADVAAAGVRASDEARAVVVGERRLPPRFPRHARRRIDDVDRDQTGGGHGLRPGDGGGGGGETTGTPRVRERRRRSSTTPPPPSRCRSGGTAARGFSRGENAGRRALTVSPWCPRAPSNICASDARRATRR